MRHIDIVIDDDDMLQGGFLEQRLDRLARFARLAALQGDAAMEAKSRPHCHRRWLDARLAQAAPNMELGAERAHIR